MGCCCGSLFGFQQLDEAEALPVVTFDRACAGPKVIISSFAISGTGSALATTAIDQDRAFFEVKVLKAGAIRVGVSHKLASAKLAEPIGDGQQSWAVNLCEVTPPVTENDVIGVCFDQSDVPVLEFTRNGVKQEEWSVRGIRGSVYPAVSVADGAICDITFTADLFDFPIPARFGPIMPTRDLI